MIELSDAAFFWHQNFVQTLNVRYAQQPMAIGEKINLKFEVSCGRPVVYEWMKRGVREDVTVSPPEVSVR